MKFALALVISIAMALATSPLLFTEEAPEGTALTDEERIALGRPPEPFTLETKKSDDLETAKFKAALRLLNSYTITINQINGCAASVNDANAKKILAGFHGRNGTVMGQIMRQVKKHGGLTQEIRKLLDERAAGLISADPRRGNCQAQLNHIAGGGEDLYKAAKHSDDYRLIRQQIE